MVGSWAGVSPNRWTALLSSALQHGWLICIAYTTPSVLLSTLRNELSLSVREVAFPLVAYKALVIVLLPVAGIAVDRIGLRSCLLLGTALAAVAGIAFSFVNSLISFVLVQLIASTSYVFGGTAVSVLLANTWWENRLGFSVGVVLGGSAIANTIMPLVIGFATEAFSWRVAVAAQAAFFAVVVMPLVFLFCRENPEWERERKPPSTESWSDHSRRTLSTVLASADFWMLAAIYFQVYFQLGMVYEHIIIYFREEVHLSLESSSGLYALLNFAIFGGKFLGGIAADHGRSRQQALVASALLMMVSTPLLFRASGGTLATASDALQLGAFQVIYGFSFGAIFNALFAIVPECFASEHTGFVQSSFAAVYYFSSLVGSFTAAWLKDLQESYYGPFLLVVLAATINFLLTSMFAYYSRSRGYDDVDAEKEAAMSLLRSERPTVESR